MTPIDAAIDAVTAAQQRIKRNREHAGLTRVIGNDRYTSEMKRIARLRLEEIERELKRRHEVPHGSNQG